MKVNLEKLADSLDYLLKAQKWNASISIDIDNSEIQVEWEVPNKKLYKKLDNELKWWARKHEVPVWQHEKLSNDYTEGTTVFSFDEDKIFGDEEEYDEDLKDQLEKSMEIMDEVIEHQTLHPMGSGISLNKEVEASFQVLPQIPFETSKVQFITKSDFGAVSVPLKYKQDSFYITLKLMKHIEPNIDEVAKKLWSDLEFATLFKRIKLRPFNKKYKDLRRLTMVFQWECPSVLVMQLVEKMIEDTVKPYGLMIVGEIHG